MTEKTPQRNGVAAAIDPRQLELGLARTNGRVSERAREIVASFDRMSSEEVFAAFEELDALPPEDVRAALVDATGTEPDPESIDEPTRRAHRLPLRPLELVTLTAVRDADIFDLGPIAEEQLRIAGKAWDGRDLAAEERLDGEIEGSFAGTLEHRVLAEAESSTPLFDVLLYAGDAGSIFRAGSTDLVGAIAGTTIELRDPRARAALQLALAAEPAPEMEPEAELEPETETESGEDEVALPKKVTAKKAGAKKKGAAPKKTATKKKASAKKTVAKAKATAKKKTTAKKAP